MPDDNVTPINSRDGRLGAFRGAPTCPLCGAIVGPKGHTCRARAANPNWGQPRPVTDPDAIREHIAAVREELAKHRPPAPNLAPGLPVFKGHAYRSEGESMT